MFNSPISKSQEELVHAARTATTDYIQNGTDLTEAVVKAASAIQPLTQEHVRRICEMTYHDAYERLFAEKTGMYQYVTFDPPDAIKASEMLDAIQMEVAHQPLVNKLASTQMNKEASILNQLKNDVIDFGKNVTGANLRKAVQAAEEEASKLEGLNKKQSEVRKRIKDVYTEAIADAKLLRSAREPALAKIRMQRARLDTAGDKIGLEKLKEMLEDQEKVHAAAQKAEQVAKSNTTRDRVTVGAAAAVPAGLYAVKKLDQHEQDGNSVTPKVANAHSMPREFQRVNAFDLWVKSASGIGIQDSNPTRELQQVHRNIKDSISTVKSDLYSAEQNEKLAMIDMVKQAKAGLSAGHSMEQVLHAALSAVDVTEPFMAKTAHDLCSIIIEACADHQNSGVSKRPERLEKEASLILIPTPAAFTSIGDLTDEQLKNRIIENELMKPTHTVVGGLAGATLGGVMGGNLGFLRGNVLRDAALGAAVGGLGLGTLMHAANAMEGSRLKKNLEARQQEVNPNHPIPQKFKKLAEANIQRKHLEITLDELKGGLNYFNQRLQDEFLR